MNNTSKKKIQMNDRTILLSFLLFCPYEQSAPIASSFSIEVAEDKTSPVVVQLKNESSGAYEYEWTFEGGEPSY